MIIVPKYSRFAAFFTNDFKTSIGREYCTLTAFEDTYNTSSLAIRYLSTVQVLGTQFIDSGT